MNQFRLWTLVVPTLVAILMELFNVATGGPTWTSLIVQYVPQSVAIMVLGWLIPWLPKHIKDAYASYQRRKDAKAESK